MEFSAEQERALNAVNEWIKNPDPYRQVFRLFGYAGTGKTTIARHLAEGVSGKTLFAAFTGKAAQAMRTKGAKGATTIHSLIYRPKSKQVVKDEQTGESTESLDFALRDRSRVSDASLIVIDECSMVYEDIGRDLLSFGVPVLVLGDPGQLPPVKGGGFFTNAEPDFLLEEIHRHARDNPILELSKKVREGEEIQVGKYGHGDNSVQIVRRAEIDSEMVAAADQVLVGKNQTRRRYNDRLREIIGIEDYLPQVGERMVCLRNDHKRGLFNGSMWEVRSAPPSVKAWVNLLIRSEDEGMDRTLRRIKLIKSDFYDVKEEIDEKVRRRFDSFDYGYALTVHKSQGSQWDDVVLFDESFAFREHRTRWLYTAITRAARNLTIVR